MVTLSNPLIVFLFMATFAQFAFVVGYAARDGYGISEHYVWSYCCGGLDSLGSSIRSEVSLILMESLSSIK